MSDGRTRSCLMLSGRMGSAAIGDPGRQWRSRSDPPRRGLVESPFGPPCCRRPFLKRRAGPIAQGLLRNKAPWPGKQCRHRAPEQGADDLESSTMRRGARDQRVPAVDLHATRWLRADSPAGRSVPRFPNAPVVGAIDGRGCPGTTLGPIPRALGMPIPGLLAECRLWAGRRGRYRPVGSGVRAGNFPGELSAGSPWCRQFQAALTARVRGAPRPLRGAGPRRPSFDCAEAIRPAGHRAAHRHGGGTGRWARCEHFGR